MAPGQCLSRGVRLWTSAEWRKPNTSKHPTSSHLFVVRSLLPWVLQTAEQEYEDSWRSVSQIPRRALFGGGGAWRGGAQQGSSGGSQVDKRPSLLGVVVLLLEGTPLVTFVDRRMPHTSQQPQYREAPRVVTFVRRTFPPPLGPTDSRARVRRFLAFGLADLQEGPLRRGGQA